MTHISISWCRQREKVVDLSDHYGIVPPSFGGVYLVSEPTRHVLGRYYVRVPLTSVLSNHISITCPVLGNVLP